MSYFEYYNKASLELEEQLRRSFNSDELPTMECQVILRPDSKVLAVATTLPQGHRLTYTPTTSEKETK